MSQLASHTQTGEPGKRPVNVAHRDIFLLTGPRSWHTYLSSEIAEYESAGLHTHELIILMDELTLDPGPPCPLSGTLAERRGFPAGYRLSARHFGLGV